MIRPRLWANTLVLLALSLIFAGSAGAVRAEVRLLRDADIEQALDHLAAPVLRAAGLNASTVSIIVVDDIGLNAFVTDPRHIFVTAGMIERFDSAAPLQAVLAHEAAHLANGHLARRRGNMGTARTAAGLGLLLSAAAAGVGGGDLGLAVAAGSQRAAMTRFLTHTRAEESAADIASVRYLAQAGIDPAAAVEVQKLFAGQELVSTRHQDPYMRSHPSSRDRLRALETQVAGLGPAQSESAEDSYWFTRAKAKLTAFRRAPSWTLRRITSDDDPADILRMREAIAHHRQSDPDAALRALAKAQALRPGDPYLADLEGQILLESRRFDAAVRAYRRAATAAPDNALIGAGLGRALLATGAHAEAMQVLEGAVARDTGDARALRDLAQAYARQNRPAMASLVTAERYALRGRMKDAQTHATRAADRLPVGSGPWKRAQDVLDTAKRASSAP